MRLHFSIGCYYYRRTTRLRQSIHFSRIQVLFADHVHRRSGVNNKFSLLRFKIWWRRQAPIFRRWEECWFIFTFNFRMLLASLQAASRAPCSCHSVSSWDRSSIYGALGLRKSFRTKDFGLECQRDVQRLSWILHIGSVSVCLSSSVKSMKTSAAPFPEIRNPIVVCLMSKRPKQVSPVLWCCSCLFNITTALLSPFFLDLLLGCSST